MFNLKLYSHESEFFFFLFSALFIFVLSSCQEQGQVVTTTETVVENTMTEVDPGNNGFLIQKKIVEKGNTLWGISKEVYGTGTNWRDIVAQNPFLQEPGRVYYDNSRKMWIVKIYPGEQIFVNGKMLEPVYVTGKDTTITKTITPMEPKGTPWWVWLLIGLGIAGVVIAIVSLTSCNRCCHDREVVAVNIPNGGNINQATIAGLTAYQNRSYEFRTDVSRQMFSHPNLVRATLSESSDPAVPFIVTAEYQR